MAKKETKKNEKIVELDKEKKNQETEQDNKEEQTDVKTELTIGVTNEGQLYMSVGGKPDLLTLQGLLTYAEKKLEILWYQLMSGAQEE